MTYSNPTVSQDKQPSVAQKPAPAPPVVIGPAPTGPPPKNVSVMITPTGQDEVRMNNQFAIV